MTTSISTMLSGAYQRGIDAAKAAASHIELPDPPPSAQELIDMIEVGSPGAEAFLPSRPDLSGEWGGSETPITLMEAVGITTQTEANQMCDGVCDAWERGVDQTFYNACVEELRRKME